MKTKTTTYKVRKTRPLVLKEVAVAPGIGEIINIRSAKTHLSALLELVAGGHEITITSDGKPKAKLIGVPEAKGRKTFQGMGDFLLRQPIHAGPPAEELIREDRDSPGLVMYLDSAIVVKLLVREPDSEWFNLSLAGYSFETSELALTEVRSALLAKERNGHITPNERMVAAEKFHSMVEDEIIRLLGLNRTVLDRASQLQFACHPRIPLRTLDALHVATCELHRSQKMCTTDGRMRAACEQFAIALLPARMEEIAIARNG